MLIHKILDILKQNNTSSGLKRSGIEKILNDHQVKISCITNKESHRSILHYVSTKVELKIVLSLIKDDSEWQFYFDAAGKTPLFYNADNIDLVRSFHNCGFSFKTLNKYTGRSILFEATSLEAIRYYIQQGIDPAQNDHQGIDPLMDAINKKNYQKINALFAACKTNNVALNVTMGHITAFNVILVEMYKSLNLGIENTFVEACKALYSKHFIYEEFILKMMFHRFRSSYLEAKLNQNNRTLIIHEPFETLLDTYLKTAVKSNMLDVIIFLKKHVSLLNKYIDKLSVEFIQHILNMRIFRQIAVAETETTIQHILLFEALSFGCVFTLDKLLSDIPSQELAKITSNNSMLFLCPHPNSLMHLLKKGFLDPKELHRKHKFNMLSFAIDNNYSYELTLEIAKKSAPLVDSKDSSGIKLIDKFITTINKNLKNHTVMKNYLFLLIDFINLGARPDVNTFDDALNDVQDINIFLILQQKLIWSRTYESWKIQKKNNATNMCHLTAIFSKDKLTVLECLNNTALVAMLSNNLPNEFYVNMFKKIDCPKNQNIIFFMLTIYDIINEEQIKAILPLISEPLTKVSLDDCINNYTNNINIMKVHRFLESFNLASLLKFKYSKSLMLAVTKHLILNVKQNIYMFSHPDMKIRGSEVFEYIVHACSPTERSCHSDNSISGLKLIDKEFNDILCQINEYVMNVATKITEDDRINYFLSP